MPQLTDFKVGEASPANTFLAIWVAKAAGLYVENGLDLRIVKVVGGRESGPDLSSGRLDLMHIGMSSVVRANAAGADLVTIGSLSNVIRNTMFVAPGIETSADLKGKTIGISSAGSETDPTTTLALRRLGLSRQDVVIKEIGVRRLDPVREGTVAASLMGEPYRSQAFGLGLKAIVDLYADRTPWVYSGLVVDRSFLNRHRDRALAFLRATVEGNYLAATDRDKAERALAAELGIQDREILRIAYENFRENTPLNAQLTRRGAENVIDVVAPPGAVRDPNAYMDESLHEELKAEGFFEKMKKKYMRR